MATEPGDRREVRRLAGVGPPSQPLGPRALRVGLWTTLLAPLGAAASLALIDRRGPGLVLLLPVFLAIVAVGVVIALLPWKRLHGTTTGRRILHAWAVLNVTLITVVGWSAGIAGAALPLAYAVAIVFFTVLLSARAQLAYLALLLAGYAAVLTSSSFEPLSWAMLGVLGLLASFLSRELRRRIAAHERARVHAERQWAVVGSVSRVARDVAAAEPRRVLEGVVEAIVALGYETAAIHLPNAEAGLQVVLPHAVGDDPARGIRTLPETIRSRVLDEGRDTVVKVRDVDRQAARTLRPAGIKAVAAVPIRVGERPEGVLLVGSNGPDGITVTEVEAFAMLAGTAALALGNARRDAERREVATRVADADRVRSEVIAELSHEIRKPLAVVTETSQALRETFGNEARHRLVERMAVSATALDVTLGGSLDLSLLESQSVELDLRDLDLGALVSRVADRLGGLFEGRELRASVPTGLTVEADPNLVSRAVEHLLATAATSTPPGKVVEVAVSRTGAETTVRVAGEGVIPADQLARIRQPVANGNGPAGPLIRLALASKILQLHGIELQIRSEPKLGTRIWFQLPGERGRTATAGATQALAAGTAPVQLTLDDALLPAVAARAAATQPPPVEIDEEERRSTPLVAAALAATAATSLVVTGVVPELIHRPQLPAATADHARTKRSKDDGSKQKAERSDQRGDRSSSAETGGASGSGTTGDTTTGATTGSTTGATTSGTGGSGAGGTGTGGGGGSGSVSPSPSPTPPPPGQDASHGKSDQAPGHNKDPKPTP